MSGKISVVMVALTVVMACGGCGGPKPVKVRGKITVKGEPAVGVNIQFVPAENAGRPAIGTSDNNGEFELTTIDSKDGALPGSYKVVITYSPPTGDVQGNSTSTVMRRVEELQKIEAKKKPKYVIPKEYTSAASTKLTQKVPSDGIVMIEIN